jgi:glyoxylase-like metal-dependent hydrolase (beta-lactamase superfamily II)
MLQVTAFTCGWTTLELATLLEGEAGNIRIPIPAYLIQHPKGVLVFDTGLHPGTIGDIEGHFASPTQTTELYEGQDIAARLRSVGVEPADVHYVVNSHLHFDHCGGNIQLPDATILLQRPEWEAFNDEALKANGHYVTRHFDHGHPKKLLDGEHDVFGDGSVSCVPTYGHTAGHQSLQLRYGDREMLLTADSCYLCRSLEALHMPTFSYDRDSALEVMRRIQARWHQGTHVVLGHEPAAWTGRDDGCQKLIA